MFLRILTFVGRSLVFRKGYRKAGIIIWLVISGLFSSAYDYLTADSRKAHAESMDYQSMCATGDFGRAHLVKAKYYKEYSRELGAWRSGSWRDRQAREAQEKYRSTVSYILAQEIVSKYNENDTAKAQAVINLLLAIPVEGAPLAEGEYGSGMFYNNDASISAPTAIDHVVYQSWVSFFNDCCDKVLDLALVNDDMGLANKVCRLYRKEVFTFYQPDTIKGGDYNIATVVYNDLHKDAAINRMMEGDD